MLDVITTDDFSQAGGGSFPEADIPTKVVSIIPIDISPKTLEERLRSKTPPIISRIAQERIIIDPRTISDEQIPALISGIVDALREAD